LKLIRCKSCHRIFPEDAGKCPDCHRKSPRARVYFFTKVLCVLIAIAALALTIYFLGQVKQ
jgi:uncharacterized paraquat-inducible protein A